jgi:hypothetical protein
MAIAIRPSANAVGSTRVSIRTTPTAITARIAYPTGQPPSSARAADSWRGLRRRPLARWA